MTLVHPEANGHDLMPYRTTPFPLIIAAVTACHWLAGSCAAQERQNQFFPYPVQPFAVTSPPVVDQTPQGEIVDHQSMSPDSWSAPTTAARTASPTSQPAVDRSIIRWPTSLAATPNKVNNDFDLGELAPSGRQSRDPTYRRRAFRWSRWAMVPEA